MKFARVSRPCGILLDGSFRNFYVGGCRDPLYRSACLSDSMKQLRGIGTCFAWLGLFILTVSIAIFTVYIGGSQESNPMAIEVGGAFIGVFAALTLGELMKSINEFLKVRQLRADLFVELRLTSVRPEKLEKVPLTMWESTRYTGVSRYFAQELRTDLYLSFRAAEDFNAKVAHYQEIISGPNPEPFFIHTAKQSAVVAQGIMSDIIKKVVEKYDR